MAKGCCPQRDRVEPQQPSNVTGWHYREERGIRIQGDFLLHRGEATSNDNLEVKLLEINPGDDCVEEASYLQNPSVKLQFLRPSDRQILCENRFYEHGTATLSTSTCSESLAESGVVGIYVDAISVKGGWVFFELRD